MTASPSPAAAPVNPTYPVVEGTLADPVLEPPRRSGIFPQHSLLLGLAGLHVLAVGLLSAGGGLYLDDIRAQAYAAGRDWWPFVIESNGTHLAPGARTIDWFMATMAPLQHWPAVVVTVIIAMGYAAASIAVVRRAIADPRVRLLAAAWMLFVPALAPTYGWFRQALTTIAPLALAMVAVLLLLRWLDEGRRRDLVLGVLAHLLALSFSERALVVPVVLAALVVSCRAARSRHRRVRAAVALVPTIAANLAFLAAYASGDFDRAERAEPSVTDAGVKVGRWVVQDLLPQLLGGPARWKDGTGAYSFADTPIALVVAAAVLVAVTVVVTIRVPGTLRRAAPVLLASTALSVPVVAMIYIGRLSLVDDVTAADDLRLLPDVTVAFALAMAALIDGAVRSREPRTRSRAAAGGRGPVLVVGLAAASCVLTAVSWVSFGVRWHDDTVTSYLNTLRAEVTAATGPILPTTLPVDVVPGWVDPGFTTGPLITLLNPESQTAAVDGLAQVIDPTGTLVTPRLGIVGSATVPEGFCGVAIPAGERSAVLRLPQRAPYFRGSIVQVGVLVGDAERLNVRVAGPDGVMSDALATNLPVLTRGPHRVYALIPQDVDVKEIQVDVESENTAGVCVTAAQVLTVGPT